MVPALVPAAGDVAVAGPAHGGPHALRVGARAHQRTRERLVPLRRRLAGVLGVDLHRVALPGQRVVGRGDSVGQILSPRPVLERRRLPFKRVGPEDPGRGHRVVVDPVHPVAVDDLHGQAAGPLYGEEGILYAELDPELLLQSRQRFDPAGHYHRPDILSLTVTPL